MIKAALENIFDWLSPLTRGMGLLPVSGSPIFMFHRVLPEGESCYDSEMVTSPELFKGLLDWTQDHYQVVSLGELLKRREEKNGKKPPCAITFDDGWSDVFVHAFPALRDRKMPATVFLPVRFVGTIRRFWQDRLWSLLRAPGDRADLATKLRCVALRFPWCPPLGDETLDFSSIRPLLRSRSSLEAEEFVDRLEEAVGTPKPTSERAFVNWDEVRTMQSEGIGFGSHTLSHTFLTHCDPQCAQREVEESRHELQDALGGPVAGFCYPWGSTNAWIQRAVENAGYEFAVTTETRLVRGKTNPFLLPRLAVSSAFMRGPENQFAPKRLSFYIARTALRQGLTRASAAGVPSPGQRLRIAFVIDSIDSWEDGGTEKQLKKIIGALDRKYFEPELYFLRPSQGLNPEDFPCPLRVASPRPGPKWSRSSVLYHLIRLFRTHRPHLVQTVFRDATYYGVLAARIARVPIVVISRRNAAYWRTGTDRLALKLINRLADAWQCNSRAAFESLTQGESVPAMRIEILPNALNVGPLSPATSEEKAAIRRQLRLPEAGPVLVSVANLTPVKDPFTLVEAAAQVRRALQEATFLVVGEGPLRTSLQERIKKEGLDDAVRLVGAQSDVRTFLAAADIGLLTSQSEGASNSLLEYMAMGLPSVVSDIPANHEMLDGVFFEPGNPKDLTERILELWGDATQRERLGNDYRQRIEGYAPEALVKRAQGYYSKLAAEHLPPDARL
jgi:glycosyltransferase involved in cell wall biosynthesis